MFSIFGLNKAKNTKLIITENAGKNFTTIELDFVIRENEPLQFHPKNKDWILALERQKTVITGGKKETFVSFIGYYNSIIC